MQHAMADAMQNTIGSDMSELERDFYNANKKMEQPRWT
jgi:hypothetical protein